MTKTSLSSLYRRLTQASAAPAIEADDIAAAADGTLPVDRRDAVAAMLASAPAHAKLARMLRELKTDSEALAFGMARAERNATHRVPQRVERHAAAGRRFAVATRWAGAMAACLVAVVGVFALRHPAPAPTTAPIAHTVARADVIFSDAELSRGKAPRKDELFRGDFSG